MAFRLTLLRFAVALLYLGPVLAGLWGLGPAQVPVFVILFLGWLVILRPEMWPQRAADWRAARPWLQLAGRGVVQGGLVLLCLAVGHGIGTLAGPVPLPVWLPALVSLGAILMGRIAWNPGKAAETGAFLEGALRRVAALAETGEEGDPTLRLAPLLALDKTPTEDLSDDLVDGMLDEILGGDPADPAFAALAGHLRDAGSGPIVLRRAVIRMATDPVLADLGKGSSVVAEALFVAGSAPDLLTLFLDRAEALYAVRPDLWGDFPSPLSLHEAAVRAHDPQIARRLRVMADRMAADDN